MSELQGIERQISMTRGEIPHELETQLEYCIDEFLAAHHPGYTTMDNKVVLAFDRHRSPPGPSEFSRLKESVSPNLARLRLMIQEGHYSSSFEKSLISKRISDIFERKFEQER